MEKLNKIILILSIILVILAASFITYMVLGNQQTETVQVSASATVTMPVGKGLNGTYINDTSVYHISNGEGAQVMCYNSNNKDLASPIAYAAVRDLTTGGAENEIVEGELNGTKVYSIATFNDTTHDNILISSKDKDTTLKIYESIKYSNITGTYQNDTSSNQNSSTAEEISQDTQSSQEVDYNSPNSDYYKSEVDGSYHRKEDGVSYVYEQDAITGEWSYWADKS